MRALISLIAQATLTLFLSLFLSTSCGGSAPSPSALSLDVSGIYECEQGCSSGACVFDPEVTVFQKENQDGSLSGFIKIDAELLESIQPLDTGAYPGQTIPKDLSLFDFHDFSLIKSLILSGNIDSTGKFSLKGESSFLEGSLCTGQFDSVNQSTELFCKAKDVQCQTVRYRRVQTQAPFTDNDQDGIENFKDPDIDGDGLENTKDNCLTVLNQDQTPSFANPNFGAACYDSDSDGVLDFDES